MGDPLTPGRRDPSQERRVDLSRIETDQRRAEAIRRKHTLRNTPADGLRVHTMPSCRLVDRLGAPWTLVITHVHQSTSARQAIQVVCWRPQMHSHPSNPNGFRSRSHPTNTTPCHYPACHTAR